MPERTGRARDFGERTSLWQSGASERLVPFEKYRNRWSDWCAADPDNQE
jgi:hypothetical protein